MIVTGKNVIGPWIAERTHMTWTPENSECLGLERDGKLVAGVWYEDVNGRSVMAHIAVEGRLSKEFLFVIFDYPFNQLKLEKIIAPTMDVNVKAKQFLTKCGFKETARLVEVHPEGDVLFFMLKRDDCKYLGERLWVQH